MPSDATDQPESGSQAALSSWSNRQLVEPLMQKPKQRGVQCPDCAATISQTKGGHELPDDHDHERTFGWRCGGCHNIIPCRAFNPQADTFNDRYRGVETEFRDGNERFIPVPTREVDDAR